MLYTLITVLIAACFLLGVVTALADRTPKAGLKLLVTLVCAIGAFAATMIIKWNLGAAVETAVLPMLDQIYPPAAMTVREISAMSPSLVALLENCVCAVLAPILFLIIFFILSFVGFIVVGIITTMFSKAFKNAKSSAIISMLYGIVRTAVILAVILVPITCYLDIAVDTMDDVAKSEALSNEAAEAVLNRSNPIASRLIQLDEHPLVGAYRACGGKMVYGLLTAIKIDNSSTVPLENEIDALTKFGCNVYIMSQNTNATGYGPKQAEIILDMSVSFGDSVLLPTVAGEVIFSVTEKWMNGESFWGMEKPDFGETVGPFVDELIYLLHHDSSNNETLKEDVTTTAKVLSVLVKNSSFSYLSDTSSLLKNLSEGGVIEELIITLGENARMKVLIKSVTDLGIRVVGDALGVPKNSETVHDTFILGLTDAMNGLGNMTADERDAAIEAVLIDKLDEAGVRMDGSMIRYLAIALNAELGDVISAGGVSLNSDRVNGFFADYAGAADSIYQVLGGDDQGEAVPDQADGKSSDGAEFAFSALMNDVSKIAADDAERADKIAEAIERNLATVFSGMSKKRAEAVRNGLNAALNELEDAAEGHKTVVSLASGEGMKSALVTVEDILNAASYTELTEAEVKMEAEAFKYTVNKAFEMLNAVDANGGELNLEIAFSSMCEVLNTLKVTPTIGAEATRMLFIAIAQTKTVRANTGLDAAEIRELAVKVSDAITDYVHALDTIKIAYDIYCSMDGSTLLDDASVQDIWRILSTESATIIKEYLVADRLEKFGYTEEKAASASNVITSLIDNVVEMGEAEREEELGALGNILNLFIASSEKAYTDGAWVGDAGKICTVDELVETLLESNVGYETLIETMTEDGRIVEANVDPFGVADKLSDSELSAISEAIDSYVAENDSKSLEADALRALLGIGR